MKKTQAVGIDLGTTYSSLAVLNKHGQPVTIPNQDGELSTPSVVYFDGANVVVGTEALRNAVSSPDRVVQHVKRWMGDPQKLWEIDGRGYTPTDISALILKKLLRDAETQLGKIREAVITVPALFSETQRQETLNAGHAAGLEKIQMINEPVAAALCHVLGDEGLAFAELAVDQKILVFDLGGGTLDLAVVDYRSEHVRVMASGGDPELGGLDWTRVLVDLAAGRFLEETGIDPRDHLRSLQYLSLESEQAKRSLSARDRAAVSVQHENQLKTYQIGKKGFELSSAKLLEKCRQVTNDLLADNSLGWARIGTVLVTGGASRMPMIRDLLQKMSGRTLNRTLSPDQSIAHGAASYAGMLLSGDGRAQDLFSGKVSERLGRIQQQSVNARPLGIMVRDQQAGRRVPCWLIRANTVLPAAVTHIFGTAGPNQRRVVTICDGEFSELLDASRRDAFADGMWLVQPFVDGIFLSAAMIGRGEEAPPLLLPAGEQIIQAGTGTPVYCGGRIPAAAEIVAAVNSILQQIAECLPVFRGWLGVDLVATRSFSGEMIIRVVELNPRLCTSYVGYRRAVGISVADWIPNLATRTRFHADVNSTAFLANGDAGRVQGGERETGTADC